MQLATLSETTFTLTSTQRIGITNTIRRSGKSNVKFSKEHDIQHLSGLTNTNAVVEVKPITIHGEDNTFPQDKF